LLWISKNPLTARVDGGRTELCPDRRMAGRNTTGQDAQICLRKAHGTTHGRLETFATRITIFEKSYAKVPLYGGLSVCTQFYLFRLFQPRFVTRGRALKGFPQPSPALSCYATSPSARKTTVRSLSAAGSTTRLALPSCWVGYA